MSLYLEICLQCTVLLVGMSVNLTLSPPSLWSIKDVTNTWRIHKACQILFGCLNPVADLVFWSHSAWQCVSLTGLLQQGSLMWECVAYEERDTGEWRSIGVEINGYHVRKVLALFTCWVRTSEKSKHLPDMITIDESVLLEIPHSVWLLLVLFFIPEKDSAPWCASLSGLFLLSFDFSGKNRSIHS